MAVNEYIHSGEVDTFYVSEKEGLLLSDDIDKFIDSTPFAHYRQSVAWMQYYNYVGSCFYIISKRQEIIVATSLVRRREIPWIGKSKYFIDCGPVVLDTKYLNPHLDGVKKILVKSALWIRVNPYIWGDGRRDAERLLSEHTLIDINPSSYHETIVVSLRKTEDAIWKGFRRSLKTQINKSKKVGITVECVDHISDMKIFIEHYNVFARYKSMAPVSDDSVNTLFEKIFSDNKNGRIWMGRYNGRIVSGIAVICSGSRAIYEWGFNLSSLDDKSIPASHGLHWEAIRWANNKGMRFYDFGGYRDSVGACDGINHFKLGFSNEKQKVCPQLRIIFKPLWSRLFDLINSYKN